MTTLSQPDNFSDPTAVPETIIIENWSYFKTAHVINILLIVGLNLFVLVIVLWQRLYQIEGHLGRLFSFVLSVTAANILVGVLVEPAQLIIPNVENEILGILLCKACEFSALTALTASILATITIIGRETFCVYRNGCEVPGVGVQMAVIWAASVAYGTRNLVLITYRTAQVHQHTSLEVQTCALEENAVSLSPYFAIADCVVHFVFPLVFSVACFYILLSVFRKQKRQQSQTEVTADMKLTDVLVSFIVLFSFIITNFPIQLYIILSHFFDRTDFNWMQILLIISFTEFWIDILIFTLHSQPLKQSIHELACKIGLKFKGGRPLEQTNYEQSAHL